MLGEIPICPYKSDSLRRVCAGGVSYCERRLISVKLPCRVALIIMLSSMVSGCSRAADQTVPKNQAPQNPVLTAFERYLDKLPPLESKPVTRLLNVESPVVATMYWQDSNHLLTVMERESDARVVFQLQDLSGAKAVDIQGKCRLEQDDAPVGDRRLVFLPSENHTKSLWYNEALSKVEGCAIDLEAGKMSDLSSTGENATLPLDVIFHDKLGGEDSIGWRGRFTWYDTNGVVMLKGSLPDGLGTVERSPMALNWSGTKGMWALRSFPLEKYLHSEAEPLTDISLLSINKSGCSIKQTIEGGTIPLQRQDGWVVNSMLDSPAWLGNSNTVLYRHVWSVGYAKGAYTEELHVWELRQQDIGSRDSKLLDMFAVYQGSGPVELHWNANQEGKLIEHTWGSGVPKQSQVDLAPFPAPNGRSIAYVRGGKIYTVEALGK